VTSEGRALTEVLLRLRNHAQKFLKVAVPPGATIVSADVAGEPAKPALGADGTRVPLLRAGFQAAGPYTVSFVYLHAGTPFARKGDLEMALPNMDMPIGIVEWEVFVPDSYAVRAIGGNVIDRRTAGFTSESSELVTAVELSVSETVTVAGETRGTPKRDEKEVQPSQNVVNLQRRAAGVLPIRVDVPRMGTSLQFVKPLVVDQETVVSFRYKRRS